MFDIVALGESLIDFTPSGENIFAIQMTEVNPPAAAACEPVWIFSL